MAKSVSYAVFSGKYSSFEYLIKCQMPTLYHTPTLYPLSYPYPLAYPYPLSYPYPVYSPSSRETNITQRAFRPEGWYWSRVIRHMIRILPCFIHFIIYLNRRVYLKAKYKLLSMSIIYLVVNTIVVNIW
jgi:hypothetical protein